MLAEFAGTSVLADWAAHPETNGTAMEESLRWTSPVNHLLRHATRDTEVHDTPIAAGDTLVVWPGAANRDEGCVSRRGDVRHPHRTRHVNVPSSEPHVISHAGVTREEAT